MVHLVENKEDLIKQLEEAGGKLVVIDFYATWCGPCKAIAPSIEELDKEHSNVVFLKVDVDENQDLAEEYGVEGMPTFVFLKNKTKVFDFAGANLVKLKESIATYA